MIQELFTGNTGLIGGGENTISKQPNNTPFPSPLSSTSPASSASVSLNSENLKCPRCDSPNTKFCYYNNYNLTQPRHFCKTCRRYWTKGGALRNVPIGGGCRKNKNSSTTNTSATKSSAAKLKASLPFEIIGKAGFIGGYEQDLIPSNSPFLFSSPQTHPFLSLLRGNQTPTGSFGCMYKDERPVFGCAELDGKSHEMNSYNQLPSNLLKNNHHPELLPMQNGTIIGEVQSTGLQELYQRLKASTSRSNFENYPPLIFGNTSSSSSIILESAPVTGGTEVAFWNTTIPTWSDLPTAVNAAYH